MKVGPAAREQKNGIPGTGRPPTAPARSKVQLGPAGQRARGEDYHIFLWNIVYSVTSRFRLPFLRVFTESPATHALVARGLVLNAQAVHVSKAGFLWKRARVKRTWLRRWYVVRKGVFRYCSEPGQVRVVAVVLPGLTVIWTWAPSARKSLMPCRQPKCE